MFDRGPKLTPVRRSASDQRRFATATSLAVFGMLAVVGLPLSSKRPSGP